MVGPTACYVVLYPIKIPSLVSLLAVHSVCGKEANCHAVNVLYCWTCTSCGVHYVGCTTKLRSRIDNHGNCIRLGRVPRDYRLYEHFCCCMLPEGIIQGHHSRHYGIEFFERSRKSLDRPCTYGLPDGLNVNHRLNFNRF